MNLAALKPPVLPSRAATWDKASENYQVLEHLGRGAQGDVYLVRDKETRQIGVAKVAVDAPAADELQREAGSLWRLVGTPGVPVLIEIGRDYLVTEYIEGAPMNEVLFDGPPLSTAEKLCLIRDIASTIEKVHRAGIIHADLKPENILATEGRLVLIDFAMAFEPGEPPLGGTPGYASPEQETDAWGITGPRTDVYALGVIAYEALTGGKEPFGPDDTLVAPPVPIRRYNPHVPATVEALVEGMLDPEPRNRPSTETIKRTLARYARKCPWVRHG